MKKPFLNNKTALLAFLVPLFLATISYHCVFVSDAGRGAQGYSIEYPKLPTEKVLELEKDKRWTDTSAWGVHALVVGLPVGLLSLLAFAGSNWIRSALNRREKSDDVV